MDTGFQNVIVEVAQAIVLVIAMLFRWKKSK